jgi:hypothetical protein
VIIGYYKDAEKSKRYAHKITNQQFNTHYIKEEINRILSYQSDVLHWNLSQIEKVGKSVKPLYVAMKKFQGNSELKCIQRILQKKE